MTIYKFNCFSANAGPPLNWKTGTVCLLFETNQGLTMVDCGLGEHNYVQPVGILNFLRTLFQVPFDPAESVLRQVKGLGIDPRDVRHIILTHLHFDHAGGLRDFPQARVHVHRAEHQAFVNAPKRFSDYGYDRTELDHRPDLTLYDSTGEKWYDFDAIRLPGFEPQIWLVPLFGHTPGQCGVAIQTQAGWHFHVGDAGVDLEHNKAPDWTIKMGLGPHWPRLRTFARTHPEIHLSASHMWISYFQ